MDVFTQSSVIGGDDGDLPSLVDQVRSGKPFGLDDKGNADFRGLHGIPRINRKVVAAEFRRIREIRFFSSVVDGGAADKR